MNFLDLNGNVKPLGELDHESLLRYTQRGVNTVRFMADYQAFKQALELAESNCPIDSPEWAAVYEAMWRSLYDRSPLALKAMIDECRKRGLALDESR